MAIYSLQQRVFIVKFFYQSGNSVKNVLVEFPNQFIDNELPSEDQINEFVNLFEEFGNVYGPNNAKNSFQSEINYLDDRTIENVEVKADPCLFEADFNVTDSLEIPGYVKIEHESDNDKHKVKKEFTDVQKQNSTSENESDDGHKVKKEFTDSEKSNSASESEEDDNRTEKKQMPLRKPMTGRLRIKCEDCDKVFNRNWAYDRHRKVHDNTCKICNKRIINMKAHMEIHDGVLRHECRICHQRFKFKDRLNNHIASKHSEERPFKCETCQSTFKTKDRLREHKKTHIPMEKRPKKCDTCEKRFLNNVDLKRHTRTHTGEKTTLCNICGKAFKTNWELKVHGRVHSGERPHSCEICGKTFDRNTTLIIHKRRHMGVKPYKCRYCEKTFTDSGGRSMHERVHIDDKPYKCHICNKAYNFASSLRSHMKISHS